MTAFTAYSNDSMNVIAVYNCTPGEVILKLRELATDSRRQCTIKNAIAAPVADAGAGAIVGVSSNVDVGGVDVSSVDTDVKPSSTITNPTDCIIYGETFNSDFNMQSIGNEIFPVNCYIFVEYSNDTTSILSVYQKCANVLKGWTGRYTTYEAKLVEKFIAYKITGEVNAVNSESISALKKQTEDQKEELEANTVYIAELEGQVITRDSTISALNQYIKVLNGRLDIVETESNTIRNALIESDALIALHDRTPVPTRTAPQRAHDTKSTDRVQPFPAQIIADILDFDKTALRKFKRRK